MTVACQDDDIQRWTMVPEYYSEADARAFVAYAEASRCAGTSLELSVVKASDETEVLDAVGLVRIDWERAQAEVGYWTAPRARRPGVAVRALRLLSTWSFNELRLTRLHLTPFAVNAPSIRGAERAGYTREGAVRLYYKSKRGLVDVVMYSLPRSDG